MDQTFNNHLNWYLETKPPFALLINGKWGSGKTYYFTNKYKKVFSDKIKGDVIYTSANGITSTDELKRQILFRNLKIGKKKAKSSISNTITSFATSLADNYGLKLTDLATVTSDDVLIIDDLERRDESLPIEQILAFVSIYFTELNNTRVLLIADEEKMIEFLKDGADKYLNIKEKTICRTVNFKPNLDDAYSSLILKYSADIQAFLVDKKEFILNRCKRFEIENLRTLITFFDGINLLKEHVSSLYADKDNFVINTLLILTNEYKKGNSLYKNGKLKSYLKNEHFTLNPDFELFSGEEVELTPIQIESNDFSERYFEFSDNRYHLFPSLVDLVINNELNPENFKSEFNSFFKRYDKNLHWYIALNKLKYPYLFEHEKDFKKNFEEVKTYIKMNKYSLDELALIAHNFEIWSEQGYDYNMPHDVFYKFLMSHMTTESPNKYDHVYSMIEDDLKQKNENFRKLVDKKFELEELIFQKDRKQLNAEFLDKFDSLQEINPIEIRNFLSSCTNKQITLLADYIFNSSSSIVKFSSWFRKDKLKMKRNTMDFSDKYKANFTMLANCLKGLNHNKFRYIQSSKLFPYFDEIIESWK